MNDKCEEKFNCRSRLSEMSGAPVPSEISPLVDVKLKATSTRGTPNCWYCGFHSLKRPHRSSLMWRLSVSLGISYLVCNSFR
jgi:hypothetical protein